MAGPDAAPADLVCIGLMGLTVDITTCVTEGGVPDVGNPLSVTNVSKPTTCKATTLYMQTSEAPGLQCQ